MFPRRLLMLTVFLLIFGFTASAQTVTVQFGNQPGDNIYSVRDHTFQPGVNVSTSVTSTVTRQSKGVTSTSSVFELIITNAGNVDAGEGRTNGAGNYLYFDGIRIESHSGTPVTDPGCLCNFPSAIGGFPDCLANFISPGGPRIHPQNFLLADGRLAHYAKVRIRFYFFDVNVLTMPDGAEMYKDAMLDVAIYTPGDCVDPLFSGVGIAGASLTNNWKIPTLISRDGNQWKIVAHQGIGIIEYGNKVTTKVKGKTTTLGCATCMSSYSSQSTTGILTTPISFETTWTIVQ